MKLLKGKVNLLIDGQFGSTGKGLIASYIGSKNKIDLCVSNAGPNSGHTFYYNNKKCVTRQLPVTAITNPESMIYLCSGSVINIDILLNELDIFDIKPERLSIHPNAVIIQDEDLAFEQKGTAVSISSTQNGVGAALARKINRQASVATCFEVLKKYVREINVPMFLNGTDNIVFMEVPQGFSLSLNSKFYPYCTSRDISVSSSLNDLRVHPNYLGKTIVSIRTYPIRVGNLPGSYSGDFYSDSREIAWTDLDVPTEYTTNTNRARRVATFSITQYNDMIEMLVPDYVFLNFCNYMTNVELKLLLSQLPEVTHLGYGPEIKEIKEL